MTRTIGWLLIFAAVFALCGALVAQDIPPPPPTVTNPLGPRPAMPVVKPGVRNVLVGPNDSLTSPRFVRGKLSVIANVPKEKTPASVELFVDNRSIGTVSQKPFQIEFDSSTLQDGEHILKTAGKDASGSEIWSASLKVMVTNASPGGTVPPAPGNPPAPSPGFAGPGSTGPTPPVSPPPGPGTVTRTSSGPVSLDQAYTNPNYRFTIRIPSGWTVKDQTASMKPKLKGGFWFVFGSEALDKSPVVVNLRHQSLDPGTDADKFARYNSYVLKWQRKTVNGSPAFATVVGTPAAKRVTHRMIIVREGSAWMLNLIDTSGGPIEQSAQLFESIANSLQPQ